MVQKINGKDYENIDRNDVGQSEKQSQIKCLKAVPFIKDKDNQTEKQGVEIIESIQVREQDIKQGLGDTGASNQGDDIKLKVFGIFQALGNEIRKKGKGQSTQGAHYQFMLREKENGRMVNDHRYESNEFNHVSFSFLIPNSMSMKST